MSRFHLRSRWAVWLCLLWCLAAPALAPAQDKGAAGVLKRSDAALSPEALPQVLSEGVASLKGEIAALKKKAAAGVAAAEAVDRDLNELKARLAALKASMALKELTLAQAEEALKALGEGEARLGAHLKELGQLRDRLAEERRAKAASLATLQQEVNKLKKIKHPITRSPKMQKAYRTFLALSRDYASEADKWEASLDRSLRELEKGREELAAAKVQITDYLDRSWREQLLTRFTVESLGRNLLQQVSEAWRTTMSLPGRAWGFLKNLVTSGAMVFYVRDNLAPLFGLIIFLIVLSWSGHRLRALVSPKLKDWQAEVEEIGLKGLICVAQTLAANLLLLGLVVWLGVAFWTLGVLDNAKARLAFVTLATLVALRLGRRLVKKIFAGEAAGGILPLEDAAARFYRRQLGRLLTYILLFGVLGLRAADLLGFSPNNQRFLAYFYEVGLLGWAVWLLRTQHLEELLVNLGVPEWFRRKGMLKFWRTMVFLMLGAIILSGLLGFSVLSAYVAKAAAFTGLVLVLTWILWQGSGAILRFVLHPQVGRLAQKYPVRGELLSRYYRSVLNGIKAFLVLAVVLVTLQLWGIKLSTVGQALEWVTWGPVLGPFKLTPLNLALTILIIYLGYWFSRLTRTFLELRVYPRTDWDTGIQYTISTTLHYAILIVAVLLVLNTLGFPLTNVALVFGALGVGIGFGLQNIVNNFISGLILLFERPIKVGDMLVVDGQWGMVKEIRVRSTVFETFDRCVLIIPNSELLSSKIQNWTHYGWGLTRLALEVGVAYHSDVRQVTQIIEEVCRANPRVAEEPPPQVFFKAYGDSALNFSVWVHVKTPKDRIPTTHELNSAIFEAFQANGIEIPFPQRDLHIKNWPAGGASWPPPGEEK